MAVALYRRWRPKATHAAERGVVRAVLETDPDFRWRGLVTASSEEGIANWLRRHGMVLLAVAVTVGVVLTMLASTPY